MSALVAARPLRVSAVAARPVSVRARSTAARPLRRGASIVVRAEPAPNAVENAIKEAEETCKDGTTGECAAAWDEVEEISAAISHKKDAAKADPASTDPLEQFCESNPAEPECRVYDD